MRIEPGRPSNKHRHPDHPGAKRGLLPEALQQMVDAAKLLFGAGLMLAGKDELLTWASTSDAHAERAEAVQAEPGAGPAWSPGNSEAQ
jgi:hypothetical protein